MPMFTILFRENETAEWNRFEPYGEPYLLENPRRAADMATSQNTSAKRMGLTRRYRVSKLPEAESNEWRDREKARFASGSVVAVPWSEESWFADYKEKHFCYISSKKGSIAYTESVSAGMANKQTRMRPGRYLAKYFEGVLSGPDIALWCAKMGVVNNDSTLQFASTPEDILNVYLEGPDSCMAHGLSRYSSSVHPVKAYGNSDLQVAYCVKTDEDCMGNDRERIIARTVCWPEKKRYSVIYGDNYRLTELLTAAGYVWGNFDGARLRKIGEHPEYVCPYIDDAARVDVVGEYLVIDDDGDYDCQMTNGLVAFGKYCPCCGNRRDAEFTFIENVEEYWCEYCVDSHAYTCSSCEQTLNPRYTPYSTINGRPVCSVCRDAEFTACDSCGEYAENGDITCTEHDGDLCVSCEDVRVTDSEESEQAEIEGI